MFDLGEVLNLYTYIEIMKCICIYIYYIILYNIYNIYNIYLVLYLVISIK